MGSKKMTRKRVYRETMDAILEQKGLAKAQFSDMIGHSSAYYTSMFQKGYTDLTDARITLWAKTLEVSEDLITAIPSSKREPVVQAENPVQMTLPDFDPASRAQVAELHAMLVDGFAMLHQDLQMLIETMHRYWKPEEPKYEVKEREQE